MQPIRILYINGGIMHRGGIESYMMNYYRNIDKSKIQIDFIVHGFQKGDYDDEIEESGGKIYRVPIKSKDYLGNIKALRKIFSTGMYQIVHSHMDAMSMVVLREAKRCGIPVRIAHSHNTEHLTNNKLKYFLNERARKNLKKYATHLFACSMAAGIWLYGQDSAEQGKIQVIHNAIDLEKFKYHRADEEKLREKYGLEDNLIIGHVGRFDYQKNHEFLLRIFKAVLERNSKAKLVLIGDGDLRNDIENQIEKLHLENNVLLLGKRDDVNVLMNMFDLFLLPSRFEGLPVVLIEAQAEGICCFTSDAVTKEADITGNVMYLPVNERTDKWATEISNRKIIDKNCYDNSVVIKNGYSIQEEAIKLQKFYISLQESM